MSNNNWPLSARASLTLKIKRFRFKTLFYWASLQQTILFIDGMQSTRVPTFIVYRCLPYWAHWWIRRFIHKIFLNSRNDFPIYGFAFALRQNAIFKKKRYWNVKHKHHNTPTIEPTTVYRTNITQMFIHNTVNIMAKFIDAKRFLWLFATLSRTTPTSVKKWNTARADHAFGAQYSPTSNTNTTTTDTITFCFCSSTSHAPCNYSFFLEKRFFDGALRAHFMSPLPELYFHIECHGWPIHCYWACTAHLPCNDSHFANNR